MVYRKANGEVGTLDYREKHLYGIKRYVLDDKVIPGKARNRFSYWRPVHRRYFCCS
jgi:hypothetical protein